MNQQRTTSTERGQRGGRITLERYGQAHFAAIGRAGYESRLERHHNGDPAALQRYLCACRWANKVYQPTLGCRVQTAVSLVG
jgi:hypothetical protein